MSQITSFLLSLEGISNPLQNPREKNDENARSTPPSIKKRAPNIGVFAANIACGFLGVWRGGARSLIVILEDFAKGSLTISRDNSLVVLLAFALAVRPNKTKTKKRNATRALMRAWMYAPLQNLHNFFQITVEKQTTLKISGSDKQLVGVVASKIKTLRKIEPYKGKGVREKGQHILKKEGKKK